MRVLPHISQPTLDTFRRDVYRPRLALLLLILLLSGKGSEDLSNRTRQDVVASFRIGGAEGGVSGSSAHSASTASFAHAGSSRGGRYDFSNLFGFGLSRTRTKGQGKGKGKERIKSEANEKGLGKGKANTDSTVRESSVTSPNRAKAKVKAHDKGGQPAPGSVFYLPRPSLSLLLDADVLPAILPLHVLWVVRLGGMMVEDGIVKSTMAAERGRTKRSMMAAHGLAIAKIIGLVVLAMSAFAASTSSMLRGWGPSRSNVEKQRSHEQRSLLPLHVIVFLELTATLLSLVVPLTKLSHPRLDRLFPQTLRIPSPSHSPGIIDMLPLPPGLADVLTGRASSNRYSNRAMAARRRQRALNHMGTIQPGRRHGALLDQISTTQETQTAANVGQNFRSSESGVPHNPMRLYDADGRPVRPGKVPRIKGVEVQIELSWLLENLATLWGHAVGAIEYAIVTLSLPTLSPTSLPPVLSLLSLRSQLGAVAVTWTSARRSVECLEFVRRRWGVDSSSNSSTSPPSPSARTSPTATAAGAMGGPSSRRRARSSATWRAGHTDDVMCSICFEVVRYGSPTAHSDALAIEGSASGNQQTGTAGESCTLDCGHELHAVCLVQWLTKQAFCPCCHAALSFSPPLNQEQEPTAAATSVSSAPNDASATTRGAV